jgi:hypothetical protein
LQGGNNPSLGGNDPFPHGITAFPRGNLRAIIRCN